MKMGNSSLGKSIFLPKSSSIRYRLMATAANEAGGALSVKYYGKNVFIVSDPVLGRELHTKHASSLMRGGFPYKIVRTLVGVGPLTANGIEWLDYRQDLNPSLSESAVSPYLPTLVGSYADLFNRWVELARPGPISIRRDDILHTVYSVVSRLVFGFKIDDTDLDKLFQVDSAKYLLVGKLLVSCVSSPFTLPSWIPFSQMGMLNKLCSESDKVLQRQLDIFYTRHGVSDPASCILDTVYSELTNRDRCPLDFRQKRELNLVKNLFHAATMTTGLALDWALRVLSAKPHIYEVLQHEVDSLVGDDSSIPMALPSLQNCRAFILEVLRLYNPATAVVKTVACDISYSDGFVPRGSILITSIYGIHTNNFYWEDPFLFRPERFRLDSYPNDAYWPFFIGGHACPGKILALSELISALVLILRRFKLVSQPFLNLNGIQLGPLMSASGTEPILLELRT
jgi:cytochrome P450